jgi:hypothetical protein
MEIAPAMARLHEYQGKAILAANGFKIPRGPSAAARLNGLKPNSYEVDLSVKDTCTSLLRVARCGRGNEFLEARIIWKVIYQR